MVSNMCRTVTECWRSTTEESIANFYGDEEEGSDDDVVAMSMFDDAIPHEAV